MFVHQAFHQGKPDAGSLVILINLIKAFENIVQLFLGNTFTAVFYVKSEGILFLPEFQFYFSFVRCKFEGVG